MRVGMWLSVVVAGLSGCVAGDIDIPKPEDSDTMETDTDVVAPNNAPVVEDVTIAPDPVFTNDVLTATATVTDADGDATTQTYTWYVNGAEVQSGPANALDGSMFFDKGNTVQVVVTSVDTDGESGQGSSPTLTVANTAPGAPTISISPADATDADDLICSVDINATDADNDFLTYTFTWLVDGADSGITGDTVSASETNAGEEWTCEVVAGDGDELGPVVTTTTGPLTSSSDCWSVDFDRVNLYAGDSANVPYNPAMDFSLTDAFSFGLWVQLDANNDTTQFMGRLRPSSPFDGWTLYYLGAGSGTGLGEHACFQQGSGTSALVCTTAPLPVAQWVHLAATYDGSGSTSGMRIWLNGEDVSMPVGNSIYASGSGRDITFGSYDNQNRFMDGNITNAFLFERELTSVEIHTIIEGDQTATSLGALGDWKYDATSTSALTDHSGNGLHGTLLGATWVNTCPEEDLDSDGVPAWQDCDDDDPNVGVCDTCNDGTIAHSSSGIDFVEICSGSFDMGCTPGQSSCDSDELPVMPVTLTRNYYLSQTEITQGQYQALMGTNPSFFSSCGTDCPVEEVTWHMAAAFANEVSANEGLTECYTCSGSGASVTCDLAMDVYACDGYRLPTEAEWEGAARCGEDTLYAGSDTIDDVAFHLGNSSGQTHAVASKVSNACGLYDMSGNVWEWTQDWYSSIYTSTPITDPTGAGTGSARVFRGGAWDSPIGNVRVASRYIFDPADSNNGYLGFRLARTVDGDYDGDGYLLSEDCDDTDPYTFPGAVDLAGDGIDRDCDGLDCSTHVENGSTYLYCADPLNQSEAASECNDRGMMLVEINDTTERDLVYTRAASNNLYYQGNIEVWIGLDDLNQEGQWSWPSGTPVNTTFWNAGQPDGGTSQDCVVFVDYSTPSGRWHDSACSNNRPFVCESL